MKSFKQFLAEITEARSGALGRAYIVGPNGKWFHCNARTHSDWVEKNYKKIGVTSRLASYNPKKPETNYNITVEDAIWHGAVRIVVAHGVVEMMCKESALTPKVRKACADFYENVAYGHKVWIYVAADDEGGDDGEDGRLLHNFPDPNDAMQFFERGKVVQRSKIGSTMAQFR